MVGDLMLVVLGFMFAVILGVVVLQGTKEGMLDLGRAQAVACSPGTYVQDLNDGRVLCVGGMGETWAAAYAKGE